MQLQWWQYFNNKIAAVAKRLDLWGFFCVKKKQQTLAKSQFFHSSYVWNASKFYNIFLSSEVTN